MARRPQAPRADAPYPPGWEPFLAAINADLDDDTARLVFADWLQENGDEDRAEFIRIQCALYRVHPEWEDPAVQKQVFTKDHYAANTRQNELRGRNFHRWVGSLPAWTRTTSWSFQRGFTHFFAPTALQWIKDGERVRQQTAVEELVVTQTTTRARNLGRDLFASPAVVGLKRLALPNLDSEAAQFLADSPTLDSLTNLEMGKLGHWVLSADSASAVIASPRLTNLRALSIHSNYVGAAVANALIRARHICELEVLNLVCTALPSKAFGALIASPKLEHLQMLNVQGNGIGDVGVRALVKSKVTRLEELNLRHNGLTAKSAQLLAAWPGLRSVRVLELAGAHFGPDGVRDLLASEHLVNINTLELPKGGLSRRDEARIEALPAFRRIPYVPISS